MTTMVLPKHAGSPGHSRHRGAFSKDMLLSASVVGNFLLVLLLLHRSLLQSVDSSQLVGRNMVWHGGHPAEDKPGSCWCSGTDGFCMCTPSMAIDLIIVSGKARDNFWLVRRKDTNQLAVMGGFVEVGEPVENTIKRELMEEMNVEFTEKPMLFGVYSDPRRDNRRRTASAVFMVYLDHEIHPRAGDDAKEVKSIHLDDIEKYDFFADHRTILLDYRNFVKGQPISKSTEGDFAPDISRSICLNSAH